MRAQILNRQFQHPEDGWYQIEVPGEHKNAASGVIQVIDNEAVQSMVNRFNQEADNYQRINGNPFPGMLIDIEHFKHDASKETRAYGWLMRMENRNGVPFGQINWTGTGRPAVDGGDYRFFSTEYDPSDVDVLNPGKNPLRVRPLRLDGLTLTNDPNNKGGAPITNRSQQFEISPGVIGTMDDAQTIAASEAAEFLRPDFDKWLRAVAKVQNSLRSASSTSVDYWTAWGYAKKLYPDAFTAAFASGSPKMPKQKAVDAIGTIANRICKESGMRFDAAWEFVQEELPQIFNRQFSDQERIVNRVKATTPRRASQRAARIFNRLAEAERILNRLTPSSAFACVARQHPGLYGLARGTLCFEDAAHIEPQLNTLF